MEPPSPEGRLLGYPCSNRMKSNQTKIKIHFEPIKVGQLSHRTRPRPRPRPHPVAVPVTVSRLVLIDTQVSVQSSATCQSKTASLPCVTPRTTQPHYGLRFVDNTPLQLPPFPIFYC